MKKGYLEDGAHRYYPPNTVMHQTRQDLEKARKLEQALHKTEANLKEKQTDVLGGAIQQTIQRIEKKRSQLQGEIAFYSSPDFEADLIKENLMVEESDWRTLLHNDQVASVSLPKALPVREQEGAIYEIGITAKPMTSIGKSHTVWLHIHLDQPSPITEPELLYQELLRNLDKSRAAHLKSNFFRKKGKEWEQMQYLTNQSVELVKRCKVSQGFGNKLLEKFPLHAHRQKQAISRSRAV
ncbi:MAG: hypothetical protein HC848_02915 [Limnobacter sp.]|nr:hypothetical protein [Limnobacter sp.]